MKKSKGLIAILLALMILFSAFGATTAYAVKSGWQKQGNEWYYYDKNGSPHAGWLVDKGKKYYFDTKNHKMYSDKATKIADKWYYFDKSGAMVIEDRWKGDWCWRYDGNGKPYVGWRYTPVDYSSGNYSKAKMAWFWYESNGLEHMGWLKDKGKLYYLTGNGMTTGWKQIDRKFYYFNSSGAMLTGKQNIGGKTYTFNSSGAVVLKNSWFQTNSKWYYFSANGSLATGWKQISGKWYWFNSTNGEMAANTTLILNGKKYKFNASGVCTNP